MKIFNISFEKKLLLAAGTILLSIINLTILNAQSFEKEFEKTAQLIVMIRTEYDGSPEFGAGIIIGRQKDELLVATAYHVIHRGNIQPGEIKVAFRIKPDKYFQATVLKHTDDEQALDLALLSIKNLAKYDIDPCGIPFDGLGQDSALNRGAEVFPLGNPNGEKWQMPVEADRISSMAEHTISFQSLFIHKGHSGGGLLNKNLGIVGMLVADESPFGRAIRIDTVISKVKQWGYPVQLRIKYARGWQPLHFAACRGDLVAIKNLLADCEDVNQKNDHLSTPLHFAAMYSDTNAIKILIHAGADINALDADGDPPLQWAVDTGKFENVRFLVESGADINIQNKDGGNALWWAVAKQHQEIAMFLIKSGAKVNITSDATVDYDRYGHYIGAIHESPLYYAVVCNQKELVRELIKAGAKVNGVGWRNLVEEAAKRNSLEILKMLLKAGAQYSLKEVIDDCITFEHDPSIIQILVDYGANLNSEDGCSNFYHTIFEFKKKNKYFNAFIKAKIDVNCRFNNGQFPLLMAAALNDTDVIKALLKAGANINQQDIDYYCETPLLCAIHERSLEGMKILLEAGADVNATNKSGLTPIGYIKNRYSDYFTEDPNTVSYKMIELLTKYGGK